MCLKNKIIAISLLHITQLALLGAIIPEDKGTVSGLMRLGYVDQENAADIDRYTTALGGILKYETPAWNDIKLGVAGYTSQKLHLATGSHFEDKSNLDFLGENGNSFTYAGEVYVDYNAHGLNIRIGRQIIDTPFANADEIRLLPNTFEAAIATYNVIESTLLTAGYIQRWTGYDSGTDISKFKTPSEGSRGAEIFGIINKSIDRLALQAWFYSIDYMTDIIYTDAIYEYEFSDSVILELKGEMAHLSEAVDKSGLPSGIDGNVYGVGASLEMGMWTLGLMHNFSSNKDEKSLGSILSGGPYYTSMEEWGIDGMEDANAYVGTIEADLADKGVEGLTITGGYGVFRRAVSNIRIEEWNVIAVYEYNPQLSGDISYAMIRDKYDNVHEGSDGGYNRFLARLSYRF